MINIRRLITPKYYDWNCDLVVNTK